MISEGSETIAKLQAHGEAIEVDGGIVGGARAAVDFTVGGRVQVADLEAQLDAIAPGIVTRRAETDLPVESGAITSEFLFELRIPDAEVRVQFDMEFIVEQPAQTGMERELVAAQVDLG